MRELPEIHGVKISSEELESKIKLAQGMNSHKHDWASVSDLDGN